jgi:hypothetical protein
MALCVLRADTINKERWATAAVIKLNPQITIERLSRIFFLTEIEKKEFFLQGNEIMEKISGVRG